MSYWSEIRDEVTMARAPRCEKCGGPLGHGHDTSKVCRAGYCAVICCGQCGHQWASIGPVGCPCQGRDPRLRRIRAMYRARRR